MKVQELVGYYRIKQLLALLLLTLSSSIAHHCIHDQIIKRLPRNRQSKLDQVFEDEMSIFTKRSRRLQSFDYRPINIHLDFTNVNTDDPIKQSFIKDVLSTELVRRLQSFIQLSGPTKIPRFSITDCENMSPTPEVFSKSSTVADLILIVGTIVEDSDFIAYAAPCLYSSYNSRPLVGIVNINLQHLKVRKDKIDAFVSMMLHEVMHVLVLSPILYNSYPIGVENTYTIEYRETPAGSGKVVKLITPGLVQAGKEHFNCPTFDGMYLENEGSDASARAHFEKTLAGNEIMTAQVTGKMVVSFWILNLLNDSGWYKIDLTKAEPLEWGKNEGCEFINSNCNPLFREFCSTQGKLSCSRDYTSKKACVVTDFSDQCLINEYVSRSTCNTGYLTAKTSSFENFGVDSRCFLTKDDGVSSVGCYPAQCKGSFLQVFVGNNTLICTTIGQQISVDRLTITCPDITNFCSLQNNKCPNDCSNRGKCLVSGDCYCDFFSEGSDCSITKNCTLDSDVCAAINTVSTEDTTIETYKLAVIVETLLLIFSLHLI